MRHGGGGWIRRFYISSGENFHATSCETESAIKCLKPGLNPNRSCLAFSWKTSTSSNTCAMEIMGASGACCTVHQRPYTVALLHTNGGAWRWRERRWNQPICWQRWTQSKGTYWRPLLNTEQNSVERSLSWQLSCLVGARQFKTYGSNSRPGGQMWPAKSFFVARKSFQGEWLSQPNSPNSRWKHSQSRMETTLLI